MPRKSTVNGEAKIIVLVEENPKRKGTRGHQKFGEIQSGMLVSDFFALEGHRSALDTEKGWPKSELRYCLRRKFVKLG
jgi:hypothetical protein